jgi:streptomycin 6-kinase
MGEDFFARLPRKFNEAIRGAFREDGARWLEDLPRIVSEIERDWALEIKAPYANLSYHFVAPCVLADKSEAVVKIGFPGEAENIRRERKTLECLDGRGLNRLLRFDGRRFAFLLEKLSPGENLKQICVPGDDKAVRVARETMRKFWRKPPANHDFPTLENWFDGLKRAAGTNFDARFAIKALGFFEELNHSPKKMLLHGDFHHENILSAERAPFLAIDPKGIVGHVGYDIAVFLINHARWLEAEKDFYSKINRAVDFFGASFEIAPRDLRRWVFAHSVLSAWWTFEENCENWRGELEFTKIWEV